MTDTFWGRTADEWLQLAAEVERLRNNRDQAANEVGRLSQEVGRLRAELANKHGGDGSVLHVTRESQDALYADRDRARAEVERLRDGPMARVNAELRAKVEKLREELRQGRLNLDAGMPGNAHAWMAAAELREAEAEVERLRAENKRLTSIYEEER